MVDLRRIIIGTKNSFLLSMFPDILSSEEALALQKTDPPHGPPFLVARLQISGVG